MTLDELTKKAEAAWEGCDGCTDMDRYVWINGYVTGTLANQIELPSDEEIEIQSIRHVEEYGFEHGAKWMRDKIKQKQLLKEIMEADEKDGLYEDKISLNNKPFNTGILREITDQYDNSEISYGKMVELLNEIAIKWHNKQQ